MIQSCNLLCFYSLIPWFVEDTPESCFLHPELICWTSSVTESMLPVDQFCSLGTGTSSSSSSASTTTRYWTRSSWSLDLSLLVLATIHHSVPAKFQFYISKFILLLFCLKSLSPFLFNLDVTILQWWSGDKQFESQFQTNYSLSGLGAHLFLFFCLSDFNLKADWILTTFEVSLLDCDIKIPVHGGFDVKYFYCQYQCCWSGCGMVGVWAETGWNSNVETLRSLETLELRI